MHQPIYGKKTTEVEILPMAMSEDLGVIIALHLVVDYSLESIQKYSTFKRKTVKIKCMQQYGEKHNYKGVQKLINLQEV